MHTRTGQQCFPRACRAHGGFWRPLSVSITSVRSVLGPLSRSVLQMIGDLEA